MHNKSCAVLSKNVPRNRLRVVNQQPTTKPSQASQELKTLPLTSTACRGFHQQSDSLVHEVSLARGSSDMERERLLD